MLARDEALKICETVLAHAKAAGAEDAARLSAKLGRVARALRRQQHHDERTIRGSRHHRHGVGRPPARLDHRQRLRAPTALKRMADEAVQIARISPVHREYVPTLGPLDYAEARGFAARTAEVDVDRSRRGARNGARRLSHARR